jgi:hypothetical protein
MMSIPASLVRYVPGCWAKIADKVMRSSCRLEAMHSQPRLGRNIHVEGNIPMRSSSRLFV